MLDVEIGGPRLISVGRGTKAVEQPPDAVTRAAADLYLYQKDGQMAPNRGSSSLGIPPRRKRGTRDPISKGMSSNVPLGVRRPGAYGNPV